jgi:uncharacterized membrane protein YkgB
MSRITHFAQIIATPFLRLSLGLILLWIGALKFADPSPVVGLLQASLPMLASSTFVYLLGAVELVVAVLLITGFAARYAALATIGLFAATLTIFLIAPKVSYGDAGFPFLSLAGQFLLKDLVLLAGAVNIVALQPVRANQVVTRPAPLATSVRLP